MDSKTINELIRSEVWPVLRRQGFTKFDSRCAWRYRGVLIDLVNFQSFNSYTAELIGCTTFSFSVNLGVYVVGSSGEELVKQDAQGRLTPQSFQCSFQQRMVKREAIDGFDRLDVFSIDQEGLTTGACFREVTDRLEHVAPQWFRLVGDFDRVIAWMAGPCNDEEDTANRMQLGIAAGRGSFRWNLLLVSLLLARYEASPTQQVFNAVDKALEAAISSMFDMSRVMATALNLELEVKEILCFADRIGWPLPQDAGREPILARQRKSNSSLADPFGVNLPKVHLWPMLKSAGFSEFTDKLAHRVHNDRIEVVEVVAAERFPLRHPDLPSGFVCVGLGIYWPVFEEWPVRVNRKKGPRPKVRECLLQIWLHTRAPVYPKYFSAFHSLRDVHDCLAEDGLKWLSLFETAEEAKTFLEQEDGEVFWAYPIMRGQGSRNSGRRLALLAYFSSCLGQRDETARQALRGC